jgi:hypothetical protein
LLQEAWQDLRGRDPDELELAEVLRQTIDTYDKVHIHLDGLDAEFPNSSDPPYQSAKTPLERILKFSKSSRKMKLMMTYRDIPHDIRRMGRHFKMKSLAVPDEYIQEDV